MNVLYVNHTSEISGSERSLIDLLEVLPRTVVALVACPEGDFANRLRARGLNVDRIPELRLGLRLHPRHLPGGLMNLARMAVQIHRLSRRYQIDLVHANSPRAGVAAGMAATIGGPPALVHVHDCLPLSLASNVVRRIVEETAAAVLANSQYTAGNFRLGGRQTRVRVAYNAVDASQFNPGVIERREARRRLSLDMHAPLIGVVAQLTPWKGQRDAIETLKLLRATHPMAQLLLVGEAKFTNGSARYDNRDYLRSLRREISESSLSGAVHFLGERSDLPQVLRALDVLLVPSWEEPFGRTVIEAMAMELPVIATNLGGPAEIISSGQDGILLPPRRPACWAEAVDDLLRHPDFAMELGRRARTTVTRYFNRQRYLDAVLATYREVLTQN